MFIVERSGKISYPPFFNDNIRINHDENSAFRAIVEILQGIVSNRIHALAGFFDDDTWLHKVSLCAFAIIAAIQSIPKAINGRIKTVKSEMRIFNKGIEKIKQGMKLAKIPITEHQLLEFEQAQKEREEHLKYIECLPTHGNFGREQMALKRIIATVYYHLGIDLSQVRIGIVQRLYDNVRDIADLAEYPSYQFFNKYLKRGNIEVKNIIATVDKIKSRQNNTQLAAENIANSSMLDNTENSAA
ncbi:hypothetical protein [Neisseria dumasiana]|uniref:Uncharacterized protein n=1 Tax=Neisseria dumasiana TaxID=1931275 RepID=A0ABX3WMF0_9NEIS|nr:hypothetical protein [Neisseria dumasiana]OSI34571.1 hypothetical protein BV913_07245 [Neisseria dumasiana]UOO83769.1 hypothetical protein LVJ88_08710 [Neisseria dumasiana]